LAAFIIIISGFSVFLRLLEIQDPVFSGQCGVLFQTYFFNLVIFYLFWYHLKLLILFTSNIGIRRNEISIRSFLRSKKRNSYTGLLKKIVTFFPFQNKDW